MSRLRDLYENEITKKMTDKFGYKNPMMVPKIDKIVINMGVGEAKENSKLLDAAVMQLADFPPIKKYKSVPELKNSRLFQVRR